MSTSKLLAKSKQILVLINIDTRPITTRAAFNKNHKCICTVKQTQSARFQSTQGANSNGEKKGPFGNFLKYAVSIGLGATAGLATGYWLMLDQYRAEDENEQTRTEDFQATRFVTIYHNITTF